jgi:magnesium transporter
VATTKKRPRNRDRASGGRSLARSSSTKRTTAVAGARGRLFDADAPDRDLDLDEALTVRPDKRQLLWLDVTGRAETPAIDRIADRLEIDDAGRQQLLKAPGTPRLVVHGAYLHIHVAADPAARLDTAANWLDIVMTPQIVVTLHRERLGFIEDIDERLERDARAGLLDGAQFVAILLEAMIITYHKAIDRIEAEADEIDANALRRRGRDDLLARLITLRRRVSALRELLTAHREVFGSLSAVALLRGTGDDTAVFESIAARYNDALTALVDCREVVRGSIDVYMTRTAQRTNDTMKVLALATVLLLPGSLIAGLLGMNVPVPLPKDDPASFWLVVAMIAALAGVALLIARWRSWL